MSYYGLQSATLEKSANQESITATFKPTMSCEKLPNSAKRQEQPALSKKALMLEIKDDLNSLFSNRPSPRFPEETSENQEIAMELNRLIKEDSF